MHAHSLSLVVVCDYVSECKLVSDGFFSCCVVIDWTKVDIKVVPERGKGREEQ